MTRPTFEKAKLQYVHRFTLDHVPAWAREQREDGTYYAPHFASDREWYDNTIFPGEPGHPDNQTGHYRPKSCYTTGQTWPLGQALEQPFTRG